MSRTTNRRFLPNLNIVLIGKTGNGKSATGNSILLRKAFRVSLTQDVKLEFSDCSHYCIKVVDTPDLADTGLGEIQDKQRIADGMSEVFLHCNEGVHVFLLVVRLDARMTKEERDVFMTLRNIFGDSYLKDHGIVAVTHGDAFERKMDEEELEMSFEEWIRQPDLGYIGELFAECDYRCVLFDNKTNVLETKNQQLEKLLEFAEPLRKKGIYTKGKFEECSLDRKKMIKESRLLELKGSIQKRIGSLQADISDLSQNPTLDGIKKAEDSLGDFLEEINQQDEGTSLLDDVKKNVEDLMNRCQDLKRLIEENSEAMIKAEEMNVGSNATEEKGQSAIPKAWYVSHATTVATGLFGAAATAAIVLPAPVGLAVAGITAAVGVAGVFVGSFVRDKDFKKGSEK